MDCKHFIKHGQFEQGLGNAYIYASKSFTNFLIVLSYAREQLRQ